MKTKYEVSISVIIELDENEELCEALMVEEAVEMIYKGKNISSSNIREMKEENRIRMINNETGEVRECDATDEGYNILKEILREDVEKYNNFDFTFEGNTEYVEMLNECLSTLS
jgi:hypothetical protein